MGVTLSDGSRRPPPSIGTSSLWWGANRPSPGQPGGVGDGDRILLIAILVVAGVAVGALAVGHLSALVFDGAWPRYRLGDAPGILARIVDHPGDPGRAWDPVNTGGRPPGPLAWWATAAVPAAVTGTALTLLRHRRRRGGQDGAAWAGASDLGRLVVRGHDHGRLVVGTIAGKQIAVESRHSLLVLGPSQSGKTTGLAIPAILEWPGPVVATSVKGDLVADTIAWRATLGTTYVFDPAGSTTYPATSWTPLAGCETWAGAMRAAWELTHAAKGAVGSSMALADFWFGAAAKSLAPLLLAAATSGRTIGDVARWVDREERKEPLTILRAIEPDAAVAYEAMFRREERGRSSIVQVMQSAVGPYLDPAVAASTARADLDVGGLLDGGAHTLYLTAPARDQDRYRPLFTLLLDQILAAVYQHAGRHGPLDPPLLLVLDEAANIAPVEQLPTVASTAAAMGLQVVTVFQDLAQLNGRYGQAAATVVNNHRAKLLLPAVSDLDTLDLASRLIGEEEISRDSHTTDSTGRQSSTNAAHWRRLLPPESARTLRDGSGVLLYGNLPPAEVELRPWYQDRRLRRRARHPHDTTVEDPTEPGEPTVGAADDAGHHVGPLGVPDDELGLAAPVSILEAARARRRNRGTTP